MDPLDLHRAFHNAMIEFDTPEVARQMNLSCVIDFALQTLSWFKVF
jgi:hypothetical protein